MQTKNDENANIFVTSCDTYIEFNKKELIEKLGSMIFWCLCKNQHYLM